MSKLPDNVAAFLAGKRFAVAGVSREPPHPGNAIYRKMITAGYEVIPVNPNATELEGVTCYPDVTAVPGELDGVVITTLPEKALSIVKQCGEKGVKKVWFHRSFGDGSVSPEAIAECKKLGIDVIAEGCPLMYCEPVDVGHKCIRWWLQVFGKAPV